MYQPLLSNRYLTSRVIPFIAVGAVALCVALVIIVVSIMTGFLNMVHSAGRTLMGDVVISYPVNGIPYYERLIERLEAIDAVAAAAPVTEGWGLLKMPYPAGDRKQIETVQVWGIDAERFGAVTGYADTLHWRPPSDDELADMSDIDFRRMLLESEDVGPEGLAKALERGTHLRDETGDNVIVTGTHVSAANKRQSDGSLKPLLGPIGYWWLPRFDVTLTMVPIGTQGGLLEPESRVLRVVNEFSSGVFLIDDKRVMLPIRHAQEMLHLDGAAIVDEEGEPTGFVDPARATMVLVRAADGVTPEDLQPLIADAYDAFRAELEADDTVDPSVVPPIQGLGVLVQTWRQQQAKFIGPIEKERELMRVLFSIIYLVCAGLVLSIFWSIVYEKTRDIGILRSIGASRLGIAYIFLRYGAIVGVVGAAVGVGLAYLVVHNINSIHEALGHPAPTAVKWTMFVVTGVFALLTIFMAFRPRLMPVVLWSLGTVVLAGVSVALWFHRGTLIWDPTVYYFSTIPNHLDPVTSVTTMIGAVVFSILGAVLPATKAADIDPVRALRYE